MASFIVSAIAVLIAYLFGSIPMGYLVARLYGIDIRTSGSGRTGGTNVLRAAGVFAAGLTVFGDVMKGLIPLFFIQAAFGPWTVALALPAAVLGHNHSIFLKFRGGVGAGTAVGALGGISLWAGIIVAALGLVALALSRYASVLSTTIAVSTVLLLLIATALGFTPYQYIIGGLLTMLIMFNSLRENFARLRAGTERRIGQKTDNTVKSSS